MSGIDYQALRTITARELCRALRRDGFEKVRKVGSHERYAHPDGRRVTVPYTRKGQTFAIGTLRSIIERQAQWSHEDVRRLRLTR